jgi:hypothetical protein
MKEGVVMESGGTGYRNVVAFGGNNHGQCNIPGELKGLTITAVSAGNWHTVVVAEGRLFAFG